MLCGLQVVQSPLSCWWRGSRIWTRHKWNSLQKYKRMAALCGNAGVELNIINWWWWCISGQPAGRRSIVFCLSCYFQVPKSKSTRASLIINNEEQPLRAWEKTGTENGHSGIHVCQKIWREIFLFYLNFFGWTLFFCVCFFIASAWFSQRSTQLLPLWPWHGAFAYKWQERDTNNDWGERERGERWCFALCVHSDLCNANNFQGFNPQLTLAGGGSTMQTLGKHISPRRKKLNFNSLSNGTNHSQGLLEGTVNIHYREQHLEQLTDF